MVPDPDIRKFFIKIVQSVSMLLLWLLVNMFLGIYLNFAFFDEKPALGNYIFYVWFLISLYFVLKYLKKKRDEYLHPKD